VSSFGRNVSGCGSRYCAAKEPFPRSLFQTIWEIASLKKIIGALIGVASFAGAAEAQTILLNDSVVVEQPLVNGSGLIGNSVNDLGAVAGTFTLSQTSTVVFDGLTSTNSGITGVTYITGVNGQGGYIVDMGIGAGSLDQAQATLAAGTYEVVYNLGNSDILPSESHPSPADNLVDIQVETAPEIDPASTASGLTLLAGALLVMRSRRRPVVTPTFA
jgi:hypothetical protein